MRKVVLLALLALAMPIAAMATDYASVANGSNPAIETGSITTGGTFTLTFSDLSINGGAFTAGSVAYSITLDSTFTGPACPVGTCFVIASGMVTVKDASMTTLFASSLVGTVTEVTTSGGINLQINGTTPSGNAFAGVVSLAACSTSGPSIEVAVTSMCSTTGSSDVATVPEPSTLGLLGTGLIGLAGLVRRKLVG